MRESVAALTREDAILLGYVVIVYGSACLGCWGLALPTLIVGSLSTKRPRLRRWFVALLVATVVSIAVFVGSILLGERLGLPDPSIV